MIPEKMREVLTHEGVVAIVTQNAREAHVVNTWNSYLTITRDERLLIPAGTMKTTEKNLGADSRVKMTIGSREVEGQRGPGTGFLVVGTGSFLTSGEDFAAVKGRFPWARAAVEVRIQSVTQTL